MGFAIGLGPVFWLMISEIFPLQFRSQAMALCTMFNWAANFIVSYYFLQMVDAIGRAATFWVYGGMGILATIFFWSRSRRPSSGRWRRSSARSAPGNSPAGSGATAPAPAAAGRDGRWNGRAMMGSMPTKVLLVCLGNICRSPTAEGVLRALVTERGLESEIEIDSAGTGDWHVGDPPDRRATEAAARRGIVLTGAARQVTPSDFEDYDLLLAMDGQNLQDLLALAPPGTQHKVRRFAEVDVPDPYYGGADGFDRVLDIVAAASRRLLDELRQA